MVGFAFVITIGNNRFNSCHLASEWDVPLQIQMFER